MLRTILVLIKSHMPLPLSYCLFSWKHTDKTSSQMVIRQNIGYGFPPVYQTQGHIYVTSARMVTGTA